MRVELESRVSIVEVALTRRTYMDECSGDDDASAELLDHHQHVLSEVAQRKLVQQHRRENANSACKEDDEERSDSKADIIVSCAKTAVNGLRFILPMADAVPLETESVGIR